MTPYSELTTLLPLHKTLWNHTAVHVTGINHSAALLANVRDEPTRLLNIAIESNRINVLEESSEKLHMPYTCLGLLKFLIIIFLFLLLKQVQQIQTLAATFGNFICQTGMISRSWHGAKPSP